MKREGCDYDHGTAVKRSRKDVPWESSGSNLSFRTVPLLKCSYSHGRAYDDEDDDKQHRYCRSESQRICNYQWFKFLHSTVHCIYSFRRLDKFLWRVRVADTLLISGGIKRSRRIDHSYQLVEIGREEGGRRWGCRGERRVCQSTSELPTIPAISPSAKIHPYWYQRAHPPQKIKNHWYIS